MVAYFSLDNVHNNRNIKRTSDTNVIGYTTRSRAQRFCRHTGTIKLVAQGAFVPFLPVNISVDVCVCAWPMIFCRWKWAKLSFSFSFLFKKKSVLKKCTRHSRSTLHKVMQPSDYNWQIDNVISRKCHFERKEWKQDGDLFQFALLNTVLNMGHISPRTALTW